MDKNEKENDWRKTKIVKHNNRVRKKNEKEDNQGRKKNGGEHIKAAADGQPVHFRLEVFRSRPQSAQPEFETASLFFAHPAPSDAPFT